MSLFFLLFPYLAFETHLIHKILNRFVIDDHSVIVHFGYHVTVPISCLMLF